MAKKKAKTKKRVGALARSNRRVAQREAIVGKRGVVKQRGRAARAKIKALVTGGSVAKAEAVQATKRVGDYKKALRKAIRDAERKK
jgi:hypothetical protein